MNQEELNGVLSELYDKLNAYVYTLVNCKEDRDDIVQMTMEMVYKKCHQLKCNEKLTAWAFSIAKNFAKNHYKEKSKQGISIDSEYEDIVRDEKQYGEDLSNVIGTKELRKLVLEVLLSIDKKYHQIIYLKHYYDMSFIEIAEALDQNVNTVKTNYYRGLKKLKYKLKEIDIPIGGL